MTSKTYLILVEKVGLYCSLKCAKEGRRTKLLRHHVTKIYNIKEYTHINWGWTEERGMGSLYGELCPACKTDYQDALDPEGKEKWTGRWQK